MLNPENISEKMLRNDHSSEIPKRSISWRAIVFAPFRYLFYSFNKTGMRKIQTTIGLRLLFNTSPLFFHCLLLILHPQPNLGPEFLVYFYSGEHCEWTGTIFFVRSISLFRRFGSLFLALFSCISTFFSTPVTPL